MALLHGLRQLGKVHDWPIRLHVAHLNHGIRGAEANADERFVREQAEALGLPCSTERVDVPAEAGRRKVSIEEAARDCRYAFFQRVCLQIGSHVVAVAHHADDNAETIVQRFFRGTGLHGLAGIRSSRRLSPDSDVRLVRPMLNMRRSRIRAFLAAANVPYQHDSTNDALAATRNRIRHELIPLAEKCVNPQAVEALLRLSEQTAGLDEYLRETAERLLEAILVDSGEGELVLNAAALAKKRRLLQTEVIRLALLRMGCGEGELNYRHLSAAADLAAQADSGKSVDLPGGLRAEKSYTKLIISRAADTEAVTVLEVPLDVPGRATLPEQRLEIMASIEAAESDLPTRLRAVKPPEEEWLDWDALAGPLSVRGLRPGDRFCPLGMTAEKKVAEFLLDEKIPKSQRERVAVLCDQKGPIWVIPLRIDQRARVTEHTRRILRLRCARS
jgi:tRNA(Ile)-lysidine synthase